MAKTNTQHDSFETDAKRRHLQSYEGVIAGLTPEPPCGMHPDIYKLDRAMFYRERDKLRAALGMPPGELDPMLRKRRRTAAAGR